MGAPWQAIIQAIDHAMGRMQHGAEAGLRVASGQHGGSAANTVTGAGSATGSGGGAAIPQTKESSTPVVQNSSPSETMPDTDAGGQGGDAELKKIGANTSETGSDPGASGASSIGALSGAGGGGGSDSGGGIGDIGGIGGMGDAASSAGDAAGSAGDSAGDAASMVSDANAKEAEDVSSDTSKGEKAKTIAKGVQQYATNAAKGFANAGAIATGNKAAYTYNEIGDSKAATGSNNGDVAKAYDEAKKTVEKWREKRHSGKDEDKASK